MRDDLETLRRELDAVDRRLIEALAARFELIRRTAAFKAESPSRLRDDEREAALLARVKEEGRRLGLDSFFLGTLFRSILDHSVRYQTGHLVERENPAAQRAERTVVSFQGTHGAFSQLAAERFFGARSSEIVCLGHDTFRQMLEAVEAGVADYGMLPIENTTAGSINDAYDLLAEKELSLVGEEILKVDHCLVALERVPIDRIRRILSHPQAIAQCSELLATLHDCHVESFTDTAMAVRKVRDDQDLSQAAIGSEQAAELYGLEVIRRNIANQPENYTRFVVVAREPVRCDLRISCKTSLVFATRHEKGALLHCLNVLASHGINLTKLESRPKRHTPFQYRFYVDFEGNLADPDVDRALAELAEHARELKILGSYPRNVAKDTASVEGQS